MGSNSQMQGQYDQYSDIKTVIVKAISNIHFQAVILLA
jgi:hypothetical protein